MSTEADVQGGELVLPGPLSISQTRNKAGDSMCHHAWRGGSDWRCRCCGSGSQGSGHPSRYPGPSPCCPVYAWHTARLRSCPAQAAEEMTATMAAGPRGRALGCFGSGGCSYGGDGGEGGDGSDVEQPAAVLNCTTTATHGHALPRTATHCRCTATHCRCTHCGCWPLILKPDRGADELSKWWIVGSIFFFIVGGEFCVVLRCWAAA